MSVEQNNISCAVHSLPRKDRVEANLFSTYPQFKPHPFLLFFPSFLSSKGKSIFQVIQEQGSGLWEVLYCSQFVL